MYDSDEEVSTSPISTRSPLSPVPQGPHSSDSSTGGDYKPNLMDSPWYSSQPQHYSTPPVSSHPSYSSSHYPGSHPSSVLGQQQHSSSQPTPLHSLSHHIESLLPHRVHSY